MTYGTDSVVDLAGWLVQVEERSIRSSGKRCDDRPLTDRPRRVVAARDCGDGQLVPANLYGDFWCVLAPSDRLPTADEAAAEVATVATIREGWTP